MGTSLAAMAAAGSPPPPSGIRPAAGGAALPMEARRAAVGARGRRVGADCGAVGFGAGVV